MSPDASRYAEAAHWCAENACRYITALSVWYVDDVRQRVDLVRQHVEIARQHVEAARWYAEAARREGWK